MAKSVTRKLQSNITQYLFSNSAWIYRIVMC